MIALAVGILVATASAAGAGGQDQVNGTGERLNLAGQPIQFHVNARSGQAGEDATGTYWARRTDLGTEHRGRVTCLTVTGNRAAVGSQFQIQVTDNGSPGKLNDTNINFFGFDPGETGCEIIEFPEVPITAGNFVVHDATE